VLIGNLRERFVEKAKVLVWDLPVRVFHWLLAVAFIGAFVTAESERYRQLHVALGYTVLGLLLFRLVWAFTGSRYARLSSFAFGPNAVLAYLRSMLSGAPTHYVGHNPAGSWSIYAIIALGVVAGVTGYAVDNETGARWTEALHEGAANTMLAVVILHVMGIIASSLVHRENLAKAMITGYKLGKQGDGIDKTRWLTATALACGVAVLWSLSWSGLLESRSIAISPGGERTSERGMENHRQHHLEEHDG
jgi:cytochrome b